MRWRWWKTRAEKQAIADAVASKLLGESIHQLFLHTSVFITAGQLVMVDIDVNGAPLRFTEPAPRTGSIVGVVLVKNHDSFLLREFIYAS